MGELLLNPCVLARLGVARPEAEQWVEWARRLNVCHSFDRSAKRAGGYFDSPTFTWQLAMRRIRLCHLFERVDEPAGEADEARAEAFRDVVPYRDLASADGEVAGRFCEVVERLHRRHAPLRRLEADGATWRGTLRALFDDFLAAPPDAAGEAGVRRRVYQSVDELEGLDATRGALDGGRALNLSLVRQHVIDGLAGLGGILGREQPGGVTIGQLASARPLSFALVYVLGLGEGDFPGQAVAGTLDLIARDPRPTDISPPDLNRQLFLDALLAARRQLWLSYVRIDLQKDRPLYPSSVLSELVRLTRDHRVVWLCPVSLASAGASWSEDNEPRCELFTSVGLGERAVIGPTASRIGRHPNYVTTDRSEAARPRDAATPLSPPILWIEQDSCVEAVEGSPPHACSPALKGKAPNV